MRIVYRISMLMFVLFAQISIVMAQGTKPNVVPSTVYGVYEGEATTEFFQKDGKKTAGQTKKMKIEISKGETWFTVVTLKDFTLGQYSFDKIPYKDCILRPQTNKWQIYLENNLYDSFTTKDGKYSVHFFGNIDEEKSFVHKNGTLDLDFELTYNDTKVRHVFKGKKIKDTTGINKITERNGKHTVYDLQGRRVEKPSKGVYIVNGKKIIYQ